MSIVAKMYVKDVKVPVDPVWKLLTINCGKSSVVSKHKEIVQIRFDVKRKTLAPTLQRGLN